MKQTNDFGISDAELRDLNDMPPTGPKTWFTPVDRETFYEVMGPRNVHPSPEGRYEDRRGYITLWKTPSGEVLGKSDNFGYCLREGLVPRKDR